MYGDMKKGITIAGAIDVILLIVLIAVNIALQNNYFSLWFVVVIIADLFLIIGSKKSNAGFLMVWMIIGIINIVLLFIAWIGYAAYGVLTVFVATVCNSQDLDVDCQGADNYIYAIFAINAIFIYGLPIYYLYLWVVVKSHRESLMDVSTKTMQPMHQVS